MKLNQYVIYHESNTEQLTQFLAQQQGVFTPITAINEALLSTLPDLDIVFNLNKAKTLINRLPSTKEIATTLSHIKCWQAVNLDQEIANDDFVLIAEADIELVPNYLSPLCQHIERFLLGSQYEIVVLQRSHDDYWRSKLYEDEAEISSIVFNMPSSYNNLGSGLYLIRKRQIQKILARLQDEKPYWLADYFSEFCDYQLIAQTNVLLGKTPTSPYQAPKSPLFSVIVPIYNVESYLKQAVDSVLKQNFYQYEIILVNDASTDSSGDIAYQYSKQYPHIRFIQQYNMGVSVTRNNAIRIAKGDYIIFLDSDDYWRDSDVLSELAKLIEVHNQPDFILGQMCSLFGDEFVSHLKILPELNNDFAHDIKFLVEQHIFQGFVMPKIIKRSLFEEHQLYFPEGRHYEDVLWSVKLAKAARNYVNFYRDFYIYRRERSGSITRFVTLKNVEDLFYIFEQCLMELVSIEDKSSHLYKGLYFLLNENAQYTETCYRLLNQDNQDYLQEAYANFKQNQNRLLTHY